MAIAQTRDDFKQYCLRKLGSPVIDINVADEQVEDRIDDALKYYWDYHFDGSEQVYYKYQVTTQDQQNKYITLPDNMIGAVEIFNSSDPAVRVGDMFNIRYQIALNDMYTLTSVSMVPYYLMREHLGVIQQMLVGLQPIRYNRHTNKVFLDTDWSQIPPGTWLIVVGYQILDPDEYPSIWNDRWLQRYAAALIKRQWGSNLTKFNSVQLLGGLTFNGQQIFIDAQTEIDALEHEMINSYSLPALPMYN